MLYVCPLSALEETLVKSGARRMVSLMGPGKALVRPKRITDAYLAVEFNDINEPLDGLVEPKFEHVHSLLEFFNNWDGEDPVLIHCWMGISRSPAAALIACAAHDPVQDMTRLAERLRRLCPMATPNALMIELADTELGLSGRLVDAAQAIGRGAEAPEGVPFTMLLSA